jgi:hypothetical protein
MSVNGKVYVSIDTYGLAVYVVSGEWPLSTLLARA